MKPNDNISIKIQAPGMSPERLSASDLADVIKAAEKSVAAIVAHLHPDVPADQIIMGLTSVEESSVALKFAPIEPELQVAAFARWSESIENDTFDDLPFVSYEGARELLKVSKRIRAQIILSTGSNGSTVKATIRPNTILTAPTKVFLRGETVIYGYVINVGGAEPKVRLRLPDRTLHNLGISEELARALGGYLYRWIGLRGEAYWDTDSKEIADFKVKEVVGYRRKPIAETLAGLAEIAGPYYDEIEDPVAYVRELRSE